MKRRGLPAVIVAVVGACKAFGENEPSSSVDAGGGGGVEESGAPLPPGEVPFDAGPRPDARPPPQFDPSQSCNITGCVEGPPCVAEACGTPAGGTWPTTELDGGTLTVTTDCTSTTGPTAGTVAYKAVKLPPAEHYAYDLRFQFVADLRTSATIAELRTGDTRVVYVVVSDLQLRVCTGAERCAPSYPLEAGKGTDVHVYGRMGTAERFGSAIVTVGLTECVEHSTLDLDGPFPGDEVTARVGCLTPSCYLYWDDARLAVAPY